MTTAYPPTADFAGSNSARQSVGKPGHCERCAEKGHVKAHPNLGCGDVGCTSAHSPEHPMTAPSVAKSGDGERRSYWLIRPHVFRPSGWGEDYCRLCMDETTNPIHLKVEDLDDRDPRCYPLDDYRTVHLNMTWWKVEGWNSSNGASCSWSTRSNTPEEAFELARLLRLEGDPNNDGKRYEHYEVIEMHHRSVCDTYVHPVPE